MTENNSLVLRISIIARLLRTRFDRSASSVGVTRSQWRAIATVRFRPGATQREIAEKLEIREVTAGRLIDRLCAQGLAERRPDGSDRRVNRVYLTPAAGPLLDILDELGDAEQTAALDGFSGAEITLFGQFLGRMAANLNAGAAAAAIPAPLADDAEDLEPAV